MPFHDYLRRTKLKNPGLTQADDVQLKVTVAKLEELLAGAYAAGQEDAPSGYARYITPPDNRSLMEKVFGKRS